MSIFSGLPKVDSCCLCFNLKWGSILIALYTAIFFGISTAAAYFTNPSCEEQNATYKTVMDVATYVMLAINLLALIASIIFLFGIIKSIPETATIFMYAVFIAIIFNLIFVILAIVFSILEPACARYLSIIAPAISILLWLYFIIVVNSYEEMMLD